MNLVELPTDTLLLICKYLNIESIINISHVCKLFRNIILYSQSGNLTYNGILLKMIRENIFEYKYINMFDFLADLKDIQNIYFYKKWYKNSVLYYKYQLQPLSNTDMINILFSNTPEIKYFLQKKFKISKNIKENKDNIVTLYFYFLLCNTKIPFFEKKKSIAEKYIENTCSEKKITIKINIYQLKQLINKKDSFIENISKYIIISFSQNLKFTDDTSMDLIKKILLNSASLSTINYVLHCLYLKKNSHVNKKLYNKIISYIYIHGNIKILRGIRNHILIQNSYYLPIFNVKNNDNLNRTKEILKSYNKNNIYYQLLNKNIHNNIFKDIFKNIINNYEDFKILLKEIIYKFHDHQLWIYSHFMRKFKLENKDIKIILYYFYLGQVENNKYMNDVSYILLKYDLDQEEINKYLLRLAPKYDISFLILKLLKRNKINNEFLIYLINNYGDLFSKENLIIFLRKIDIDKLNLKRQISIIIKLDLNNTYLKIYTTKLIQDNL